MVSRKGCPMFWACSMMLLLGTDPPLTELGWMLTGKATRAEVDPSSPRPKVGSLEIPDRTGGRLPRMLGVVSDMIGVCSESLAEAAVVVAMDAAAATEEGEEPVLPSDDEARLVTTSGGELGACTTCTHTQKTHNHDLILLSLYTHTRKILFVGNQ